MSVTRQTTLQQIKGHLSTTGNCVYVESLGDPSNVAQICCKAYNEYWIFVFSL